MRLFQPTPKDPGAPTLESLEPPLSHINLTTSFRSTLSIVFVYSKRCDRVDPS